MSKEGAWADPKTIQQQDTFTRRYDFFSFLKMQFPMKIILWPNSVTFRSKASQDCSVTVCRDVLAMDKGWTASGTGPETWTNCLGWRRHASTGGWVWETR